MKNWVRKQIGSTRRFAWKGRYRSGNPAPRLCAISAAVVLTLFISSASLGFNIGFLDDAPIAEFNDQDIEMMLDTLSNTLDNETDGVEVTWKNPDTGNNGAITPLNSIDQDGKTCRHTLIKSFSRTFSGSSQYLLCKDDDGKWKVVN